MTYPPPIIKTEIDPKNEVCGPKILFFQEPQILADQYTELITIRLRGRASLPPERFFERFDVIAITVPAEYETAPDDIFERQVLVRPKTSNLIWTNSFHMWSNHGPVFVVRDRYIKTITEV